MALHNWPFLGRSQPLAVTGGSGSYLIQSDGSKILDAAGGAIVVNIGQAEIKCLGVEIRKLNPALNIYRGHLFPFVWNCHL